MNAPRHIAVIGAGIVGLTTARSLLRLGHQVTLIDREAGVAQGASARNGAQLSYAYVAPLADPGLWPQLPGLLWQADSPLRMHPRAVGRQLSWCLSFLAACRTSAAEHTTRSLLVLAAWSRSELEAWLQEDAGRAARILHRRNGKLVVYASEKGFRKARAQMALQARLGCVQSALGAQECLSLEPALRDSPRSKQVVGGIHTPTEEVTDCAALCEALLDKLRGSADFRLQLGRRVQALEGAQGRISCVVLHNGVDDAAPQRLTVDAVVACAGAATPSLLAPLGVRLPVAPLKGYSIDVPGAALQRLPALSLTDSQRRIVFAPLGQGAQARLRVAGMAELVGDDLRIDEGRIAQLVRATDEWFGLPSGRAAATAPWAGLRPATPSGRPWIGRAAGWRNLFVNTGQGALGLTLAFGSAALLADSVGQQAARIDTRPFTGRRLAYA